MYLFFSIYNSFKKNDVIENATHLRFGVMKRKVAEHDQMDKLWTKHLGTRMTKVEC